MVPVYFGTYGEEALPLFERGLAEIRSLSGISVLPAKLLPTENCQDGLATYLSSLQIHPGVRKVGILLLDIERSTEFEGFLAPLPVEVAIIPRHSQAFDGEQLTCLTTQLARENLSQLTEEAIFLRSFATTSHALFAERLKMVEKDPIGPRLRGLDPDAPVFARVCRESIRRTIAQAIDELGGLDDLLDPHEEVIVKPNLHYHEQHPSVTRPEALKALLEILLSHGYRVRVAESSGQDTLYCAQISGVLQVCEELGVPFEGLEFGDFVTLSTDFEEIPCADVFRLFYETRNLICLALLKTHQIPGLTSACKHLFGAVARGPRYACHRAATENGNYDLMHKLIAFLNRAIHPAFTLIDAHQIVLGKGSGLSSGGSQAVETGLLLAGRDNLALDLWSARYLDQHYGAWNPSPHELAYLRMLAEG